MHPYRNLPLRHKLTLLSLVTTTVAMLLACAGFVAYELLTFRSELVSDASTAAEMIGYNSASALAFTDAKSAQETLQALSAQSDIVAACIYDKDGLVFATYPRAQPVASFGPPSSGALERFSSDRLELFRPIRVKGEEIGSIYIRSDFREIRARLRQLAWIIGAVMVVVILLAYFLAARLQRMISGPVSDLAAIVSRVAAEKDFSIRAQQRGDDELGRLIDGFNAMLGQIQSRDIELQRARETLEQRVARRTEELAHEQARFRFIFDAVPVGLACMISGDLSSRIVNQAHAAITGVPVARCHELDLYRIATLPEVREVQDRLHAQLVAGQIDHYEIEKPYRHADGSVRWAITSVRTFRMAATGEAQEISTIVDITERKHAEAKLAEASGLLEAMLANSPDLIYFKDRASRFVRFSHACMAGFGLTDPEELHGKTDFDFYASGFAQPVYDDEQMILRTGQPIIGQLEKVNYADGRVAWVLTTKMPWRDGAGAIVGTFGISKDVTALKDTEAKLAYERDQLRALLDSSPDTIYFKDTLSRFTLVSRSKVQSAIARVSDLRIRRSARGLPADVPDAELLTGLTDFDTFDDDSARLAYEDEQKIVRTGEPIIGKSEKQTYRDGAVHWSLTSKMPWLDREGKIIGTFGISKDISDLKATEEKLEQTHRQLLQTSRQAGMAEVAIGVLHNVGNVLNSVNVSATLVADHLRRTKAVNIAKVAALFAQNKADLAGFLTKDPRGQMIPDYLGTLAESLTTEHQVMFEELEHLRKNIEHIKEIVSMQQAYARTSGVTETVSVPDLIEDALRINAGSLARHAVDTIRDYQARPTITTDKHKVMQILINLVGNAKYACDESGRTDKKITVSTTRDAQHVKIAVSDNGVGIPAENLTRIFNHGFTTRKTGHGFGLHSGALAAKELGGSLSVTSEGPGLGAVFTLELPFKPPGLPS